MITQNYKIDMTPGAVPLRVKVSQYDVGVRQLVFQLFNGPTALTSGSFDLSAQIVGTKPDKKGFEYSATVNATSSAIYVTVDITEQMTACAGDVVCEIRMYDNSNRISSANFILDVEQAALGADTDISETELPDIIDEARSYAAAAEDAAERAEQAAAGAVAGLELGKMTSFSDGTIVTDIDLHRAPVAGDRILFYHNAAVASPSSLTTYNDGVAVTTTIGDFSLTHPAGLTLMKCVALGESLRWQTVQDIADGGYTAGTGISINGTTINNSAPQLGDDIAYSRIDTVTSGALGYFSADADCLVMDFRTDAVPYNGGYTLRLTTTGASFKYAVLKDKAGNDYTAEIPSGSLVLCKSNVSGTGSEADPVVVTVLEIGNTEMAHDVEVLKDICITEKTVSGNPIVITDALPYPAVSVSAEIEAEQDLHGYDKPWVGGAGKNKLPMTVESIKAANTSGTWNGNSYTHNGVTYTIQTDSDNNITGFNVGSGATASGESYLNVNASLNDIPNGTYILNGCPSNGADDTYKLMVIKSPSPSYADKGNGITVTKDNTVTLYQARIVIANGYTIPSGGLLFKPMLRLSTESDASFAPYSNICPISGRTETSFVTEGKNLVDETIEKSNVISNGDIQETENRVYDVHIAPVIKGSQYILTTGNTGSEAYVYSFFTSRPIRGSASYNGVRYVTGVTAITAPIDGYLAFRTAHGYTTPQCEHGTVPTAYVPYVGRNTVTIQLGTTVYGGTLNVTTGVMTVKTAKQTLNSDLTWVRGGGGSIPTGRAVYYFTEGLTGAKPCGNDDNSNNITMKSNVYNIANKSYNAMRLETGFALGIGGDSNSSTIGCNVSSTDIPDASAFETWLDSNPIEIEYPLATPTTIQLTPTDLQMLKGYNRLSCDGGGDMTLTYKADRLAAIEATLAEITAQLAET